MTQERVIAQVQARLQHCLERRDRPGILALTTWLVHRHGHPLLQQLLSQPEWSSHRLWWGEQISNLNPDLQPQCSPQPQACPQATPTPTTPTAQDHRDDKRDAGTDHKALMAAVGTTDPWAEPAPHPRPHPEPEDGLPLDPPSARSANRTASSGQDLDPVNLTPAQVTRQRLKMIKQPTNPVPIHEQDGTTPTVAQAANQEQPQKRPRNRQHRSLQLRDWLPRSRLPHQAPRQDAA